MVPVGVRNDSGDLLLLPNSIMSGEETESWTDTFTSNLQLHIQAQTGREATVEILADRPKAVNGQVAPYLQKKLPFTQATMMTYWVKHMMSKIKQVASITIWGRK